MVCGIELRDVGEEIKQAGQTLHRTLWFSGGFLDRDKTKMAARAATAAVVSMSLRIVVDPLGYATKR